VAELKLIFRIVSPPAENPSSNIPDCFLTYIQRFDIVPQAGPLSAARAPRPEHSASLYVLKRAKRADGSIVGDVVPLHQLRALVDLVPRFCESAPRGLNNKNSLTYSAEFFLNKYFDKEMFWALHNAKS
jgi:hypothetical protein